MNDDTIIEDESAHVTIERPAIVLPGSPEWHAIRRSGIGGSDVATVLGLSPWRTPYELWLDKRGELPPQEMNEPMRWGNLLEPVIRQRYADVTGHEVINVSHTTFRSELHPFMLANLDGIVNIPGPDANGRLLECKSSRSGEDWGEPGSDAIPMPYLLQVQHYMIVTPFKLTDVAVLIGGSDFRIYTVQADPELQAMIVQAEADFWRLVREAIEPPIVDLPDVKRRYGHLSAKGTVQALDEDIVTVDRLRETKQLIKELGEAHDDAQARLMKRLGEGNGDTLLHPVTGKPLATWRLAAAPMVFDEKAFGVAHPDLLAQYTRPGTGSRRFLLK